MPSRLETLSHWHKTMNLERSVSVRSAAETPQLTISISFFKDRLAILRFTATSGRLPSRIPCMTESDGWNDRSTMGASGDDTIHGGASVDQSDGGAVIDDKIRAGDGDDTVFAGAGKDAVDGGAGNDQIYGGDGNDRLSGGDGTSCASFSEVEYIRGTGQEDTFDASATSADFGTATGAGNDSVTTGSGDDIVLSEDGDDVVATGAGNDTIIAGAGSDTIASGDGDDTITTGDGDDVVVLSARGGQDTIFDFEITDSDGDGRSNDQFDASALRTGDGQSVEIGDVLVSDGGSGNAVLTFPEGESVILCVITPEQLTAQQMNASAAPCFEVKTRI